MTGWAIVKDHLLTHLAAVVGLTDPDAVSDGASLAQTDLTGYVVVGWDGDTGRGSYEQDYDTGPMIAETGEVALRFVARSGDTDFNPLQDTVDTWVENLRAYFAADKTLGGALTQGSTIRVGRVEIEGAQTSSGAIITNQLAVSYFTRL